MSPARKDRTLFLLSLIDDAFLLGPQLSQMASDEAPQSMPRGALSTIRSPLSQPTPHGTYRAGRERLRPPRLPGFRAGVWARRRAGAASGVSFAAACDGRPADVRRRGDLPSRRTHRPRFLRASGACFSRGSKGGRQPPLASPFVPTRGRLAKPPNSGLASPAEPPKHPSGHRPKLGRPTRPREDGRDD